MGIFSILEREVDFCDNYVHIKTSKNIIVVRVYCRNSVSHDCYTLCDKIYYFQIIPNNFTLDECNSNNIVRTSLYDCTYKLAHFSVRKSAKNKSRA